MQIPERCPYCRQIYPETFGDHLPTCEHNTGCRRSESRSHEREDWRRLNGASEGEDMTISGSVVCSGCGKSRAAEWPDDTKYPFTDRRCEKCTAHDVERYRRLLWPDQAPVRKRSRSKGRTA